MGYLEKYNEWLNDTAINEKDKEELRNIKNDEKEEDQLYHRKRFIQIGKKLH